MKNLFHQFSTETRDQLAGALCKLSDETIVDLEQRVSFEVAIIEHYKSAPSAGARKAALLKIRGRMAKLREELETLDPFIKREIQTANRFFKHQKSLIYELDAVSSAVEVVLNREIPSGKKPTEYRSIVGGIVEILIDHEFVPTQHDKQFINIVTAVFGSLGIAESKVRAAVSAVWAQERDYVGRKTAAGNFYIPPAPKFIPEIQDDYC